jgi:hypothetical protein
VFGEKRLQVPGDDSVERVFLHCADKFSFARKFRAVTGHEPPFAGQLVFYARNFGRMIDVKLREQK